MKLSKETLEILKNFASINSNILIRVGNTLTTISVAKNIIGEAIVDESFEKEFGIYDLPEFLNVYNITDNADIYIKDNYLDISWANSKIKYIFADSSVLTFPAKVPQFPAPDVEVEVDATVIKHASVLKSPNLAIVSNGSNVKLKTFDKANPSSNSFEIDLEVEYAKSFNVIFDINTLKLLPGKYKVQISSKVPFTRWENLDRPVSYIIALDTSSSFE